MENCICIIAQMVRCRWVITQIFPPLHLADGTELMCDYTVTYKDFDNDTDYTEYVFPMAYEDVAGCTLTGDLYTASNLMDGRWAVSFRLTQ